MPFNPTIRRLNVGQEFQSGIQGLADWGGVFPTAYVENMIQRWLDDGITHVAFAAPGLSNDWVRDTLIPIHLQIIEMIAAAGIHIDWGAIPQGGGNFTKINYWLNLGHLEQHLQAFQVIANEYGIEGRWIVTNENEANWNLDQNQIMPSWQRAGNVVTCDNTANGIPHNLVVGDGININTSGIGGFFTITSIVNQYAFTYAHTGPDESRSNISFRYSESTICRIASRTAHHLKSLPGITLPMITRTSQGSYNSGLNYYFELMKSRDYMNSLDGILLNIYGEGSTDAARLANFKAHIDRLVTTFPDPSKTGISEYGLGDNDSKMPRSDLVAVYSLWKERIDYIESKPGLCHYMFSYNFPDDQGRNHLSMTLPVRYNVEIEKQPIYSYFLDQPEQSEMLLAYTQPNNLMQFSLVNKAYYTVTPMKQSENHLILPGEAGGDARLLTSGYNFLRQGEYGILGWAKMADIDAHPVNTLWRFGDGGSNGYRILVEKASGSNYLKLQDFKTFSTQSMTIPSSVDVEAWFHWAITWYSTNGTSWTPHFYINGRRLIQVQSNLTYSGLTEKINGSIFLGHDWEVQTLYGEESDVMYFQKFIHPNDIWKAIKNRDPQRASSYWSMEGSTKMVLDVIGGKHLTMTGNTAIYQTAQAIANTVKHTRAKVILH